MAIYYDEKGLKKCSKCNATTFYELPVYQYKETKPGILERTLVCIVPICSICKERNNELNDLKKYKIIDK